MAWWLQTATCCCTGVMPCWGTSVCSSTGPPRSCSRGWKFICIFYYHKKNIVIIEKNIVIIKKNYFYFLFENLKNQVYSSFSDIFYYFLKSLLYALFDLKTSITTLISYFLIFWSLFKIFIVWWYTFLNILRTFHYFFYRFQSNLTAFHLF